MGVMTDLKIEEREAVTLKAARRRRRGAELLVSAAISSHATSQTLRRRLFSSRVNSGSDKKKGQRFAGRISARDGVIHGAALYIFVR